jgi:hypothetical protein
MRGGELNYYFIGIAMAHQSYKLEEVYERIIAWNLTQHVLPGSPYVSANVFFAAGHGWIDETERLTGSRGSWDAVVTFAAPLYGRGMHNLNADIDAIKNFIRRAGMIVTGPPVLAMPLPGSDVNPVSGLTGGAVDRRTAACKPEEWAARVPREADWQKEREAYWLEHPGGYTPRREFYSHR